MTLFRKPLGTCKNADDLRVLMVGIVCTVLIFSFFTVYEGARDNPITLIDLIQVK